MDRSGHVSPLRTFSDFSDFVSISAGAFHSLGLKADGTVVAEGLNSDGRCNVERWTDIVAIAAGSDYSVGVKSDGRIIAVGNNSEGQCNVSRWKLFNSASTIDEERSSAHNEKKRHVGKRKE